MDHYHNPIAVLNKRVVVGDDDFFCTNKGGYFEMIGHIQVFHRCPHHTGIGIDLENLSQLFSERIGRANTAMTYMLQNA